MIELIFVVEARASSQSDWMYIKSALDYFYIPRTFGITKIFAKCKSELVRQTSKINQAIKSSSRTPTVIICADYDRREQLNADIENYCVDNKYELIWMSLDVEDVFLGKKVKDADKANEAFNFQKKKDILLPLIKGLNTPYPLGKRQSSNLLCICDKYLTRK